MEFSEEKKEILEKIINSLVSVGEVSSIDSLLERLSIIGPIEIEKGRKKIEIIVRDLGGKELFKIYGERGKRKYARNKILIYKIEQIWGK